MHVSYSLTFGTTGSVALGAIMFFFSVFNRVSSEIIWVAFKDTGTFYCQSDRKCWTMQNLKNIREQPFIHEKKGCILWFQSLQYIMTKFSLCGAKILRMFNKKSSSHKTSSNEYENLFKQSSIPKLDHAIPPSSGHLAGLMGVPQHLHIEVSLELSGWVVYGVDWVGISIFCAQ